jgi:hypothetical protein
MTTHTWHTSGDVLQAYLAGALDALEGASVEQHLLVCGECRSTMGSLVETPELERGWAAIQTAIERPKQPALIRLARRLGLPEPTSVLLTATASLRTAWLASSFVALAFAFLAVHFSEGDAIWPFLLVAPLIPVVGVSAAYGPATDPLETLLVTSPYGRTHLILVRTLGVLTTCLPVSVLLGLMLPGPDWVAAAWLGPALAMIPILLALASFVGPRVAAGIVAIAWCGMVLPSTRRLPATWPVELDRQLLFLVLALVAGAVLAVRSRQTRQIGAAL